MRISLKIAAALALVPALAWSYGGSYTGLEYKEKLAKQKKLAQQQAQQQAASSHGAGTQVGQGNSGSTGGFNHLGAGGFGGLSQTGNGGGAGGQAQLGAGGGGGGAAGGGGGGGGGGAAAAGGSSQGGLQCPNGTVYSGGRCTMAPETNTTTDPNTPPKTTTHVGEQTPPPDNGTPGRGGGGGGGCFVAGTPVATPQGEKAIEKLQVGDEIYAIDPATYALVPSKVVHVFHHLRLRSARVRVTLSNGEKIVATTVHRFYDPRRRDYAAIGEFKVGDKVVSIKKSDTAQALALMPPARVPAELRRQEFELPMPSSQRVASIAQEVTITALEPLGDAPTDVFNLTTEASYHNYLADGVLVHNLKPQVLPR